MGLFEITNQSRKIIKRLERLYIKYAMSGNGIYGGELLDFIREIEDSTDSDVIRERNRYESLIKEDVMNILLG